MSIDTACGGTMKKKSPAIAYDIIKDMASINYQMLHGDRHVVKKPIGVHQVENNKSMELKLETITK